MRSRSKVIRIGSLLRSRPPCPLRRRLRRGRQEVLEWPTGQQQRQDVSTAAGRLGRPDYMDPALYYTVAAYQARRTTSGPGSLATST